MDAGWFRWAGRAVVCVSCVTLAFAFACGPEATPTAVSPANASAGACDRTLALLGTPATWTLARADAPRTWETLATSMDDERRAVLGAGLANDAANTIATYKIRAEEAVLAVQRLAAMKELSIDASAPLGRFPEAMSALMEHCTAPECGSVIMLIGAHTMHQPHLEETLPVLADQLAKVQLSDAKLQREIKELADEARRQGAAMKELIARSKELGKALEGASARIDAVNDARRALRARCGLVAPRPPSQTPPSE